MLHITALMDDKPPARRSLAAEHGLSLYIHYQQRRILFDCGSSGRFLGNARALGVDLRGLDAVVLSHGHYDHGTGFRDLTEQGLGSPVLYTGPHFFEPKYSKSGIRYTDLSSGFGPLFLEAHGIRHQEVTDVTELFPGAWLIGGFPRRFPFEQIPSRFVKRTPSGFQPDDFADEICLALEVSGGLAVLVGCSHPGILNMLTHVHQVLSRPIRAVFGGTHLVEADEGRIDTTIQYLADMGLEILGLSHCSGDGADCAIRRHPEIQGCHLAAGDCIFFD